MSDRTLTEEENKKQHVRDLFAVRKARTWTPLAWCTALHAHWQKHILDKSVKKNNGVFLGAISCWDNSFPAAFQPYTCKDGQLRWSPGLLSQDVRLLVSCLKIQFIDTLHSWIWVTIHKMQTAYRYFKCRI